MIVGVFVLALNVVEAIVEILEELDVRFVFGLPGTPTLPFYDALFSSKIRHILTRHEQSASYMADAYAKVTGNIGVCDGSIGPGTTNLATGIATAWTDNSPVLVLTGQVSLSKMGKGAFQEIDSVSMFQPIVKASARLYDPNMVFNLMNEMINEAVSRRRGPVHIDIPFDVQKSLIDIRLKKPLEKLKTVDYDLKRVKQAVQYLIKSKKPLIIVGGGCNYSSNTSRELISFSEFLNLPVMTTFNGRGVIPDDHSLFAGRIGIRSRGYVDRILSNSDLIIGFGCRFAELSTRGWTVINENSKIIHVEIDPKQIGKVYSNEFGIIGDARDILNSMLKEAKTVDKIGDWSSWLRFIKEAKEEWFEKNLQKMTSQKTPLKPQNVCYAIRKCFGRDTIFSVDAGNNKMWASTFLDIYEPRTWIQSGGFGPMGYGLPAAIACKLAKPEKDVVAICGDGGFLMTMEEMTTANRHNTPITVCILNDNALGTIKHRQKLDYNGRFISVDLVNPDFVKLAEAFNWHGERIEKPSKIKSSLYEAQKAARSGVSTLLDFVIDPNEHLPP
jgi:acetolactate synthase-1/2/3 large subunit